MTATHNSTARYEHDANATLREGVIREIILGHIATILERKYADPPPDLSEDQLIAKMAFKADPQLNELRLALERMKRGEYGRCIFCKGLITESELERNPTAHFCAQCSGMLRYRTAAQRT
ncbi:MAG: hypothetical protein KFH87_06700 [Bacteroidetes bacterium]|nr:hypothetical protein [Bacteroidota bacterium]